MKHDLAAIAKSLIESLQLKTEPVAVSFTAEEPKGVPRLLKTAAAGCTFWEQGAKSAFVTAPGDHAACAVGMYTHHMPPGTPAQEADLNDSLKVFADLGYVRPEDIPTIPVLANEAKHVVYAPLATTPIAADVVLLFVNSQQGLLITEAIQQVEAGSPPALGRPACAVLPQVMNSGKPALSLGCCGARAYLDVMTDNVALWALPGARVAEYAARLEVLAKANGILSGFHTLRRKEFADGQSPSIKETLTHFQAGS